MYVGPVGSDDGRVEGREEDGHEEGNEEGLPKVGLAVKFRVMNLRDTW